VSRFTWAKAEADFKLRIVHSVEAAIHSACVEAIGPGTRGRAVAERVADDLWGAERRRIEIERTKQSEGDAK
jgi:Xaa-Pro aminopeptidase